MAARPFPSHPNLPRLNGSCRGFFTVGKQYRVPGFLATSFSQAKADEFTYIWRRHSGGRLSSGWCMLIQRASMITPAVCRHVNFVSHSLIVMVTLPRRSISLLPTRSSPCVAVTWEAGGAPHRMSSTRQRRLPMAGRVGGRRRQVARSWRWHCGGKRVVFPMQRASNLPTLRHPSRSRLSRAPEPEGDFGFDFLP